MSISFPCVALVTACFTVYIQMFAIFLTISLYPFWLWQDFATQVHYWTEYREQCDTMKKEYGRYVTPELAEHMAGKELKICHACQKSTIIGLPLHFFFPSGFEVFRCNGRTLALGLWRSLPVGIFHGCHHRDPRLVYGCVVNSASLFFPCHRWSDTRLYPCSLGCLDSNLVLVGVVLNLGQPSKMLFSTDYGCKGLSNPWLLPCS